MAQLNYLRSQFFWTIYTPLLILTLLSSFLLFLLIDSQEITLGISLLLGGLIFICLAVGFFFLSKRISVPLMEILRVSIALERGNYSKRVSTKHPGELGRLGKTLNRLGQEIESRISQISVDRAQIKTMLAGMVEGIIAVDQDQKVLFCNRAAYQLLNCPLDDCRGMPLKEVEGFRKLAFFCSKIDSGHRLYQEELQIEGSDKILKRLEVFISSFQRAEHEGTIIVLHDVTHLRKLEKIRRDFVANVSHEIKTPLTSIQGYVETLMSNQSIEPAKLQRFLEKIRQNTMRLSTLVNDVLQLARIESNTEGTESAEFREINASRLIQTVVSAHQHHADVRGIQLILNLIEENTVFFGVEELLYQIVDNLLSNALRYTPQGGRVEVSLSSTNPELCLTVKDNGIGIPSKYQERIFQRFYRVDKSRHRSDGGTGLGLAIVKHSVQQLKGRIELESEVGVGSCFRVFIPNKTGTSDET